MKMQDFMDQDFLLYNDTSRLLYHEFAKDLPIFDFHNHLSAKEIYEDVTYPDLASLWLDHDHYKWRAMRACGVEEKYITGDASHHEKFAYWAKTVPQLFLNPLYHWTHLELQRYFDIDECLNPETAERIERDTSIILQDGEHTTRGLLRMMHIDTLCTTDDPIDDLRYHRLLKQEGFEIHVLPTFRPDQVLKLRNENYGDYIQKLQVASGMVINDLDSLLTALQRRLDDFVTVGCVGADHSLENFRFRSASADQVNTIFQKRLCGAAVQDEEVWQFQSYVLVALGRYYHERDLVMQLHIGALRNNATRYAMLDAGFDSMDDRCYAYDLSQLLNALDSHDQLPKTILFGINARDFGMLATMAGNFQSAPYFGKVQLGAAWWFLDNQFGITEQLTTLASMGVLGTFVGMLTDSRSFLSFPRHEYFRRILCGWMGEAVEKGLYPMDCEQLSSMVKGICFENAKRFFQRDR